MRGRELVVVMRFGLRMVFSAESHDEAISVLRSLLGPVRAETGCSATRLLMDIDRDNSLTWVEEWRSAADFERHLRAATFRSVLAVMELAAAHPEVVAEVQKLMAREHVPSKVFPMPPID